MKASPTKATTVTSRPATQQSSLNREVRNFRGNTYNKDSTLHEADMNS